MAKGGVCVIKMSRPSGICAQCSLNSSGIDLPNAPGYSGVTGTTPNFQALDFHAGVHQQDGICDDAAPSRVFQQIVVVAGDDYFVAVRQFSQPLVEFMIHPGAFRTDGEVSRVDKHVTRGHDESPVQFVGIS